jgi:hypothetical protein
MADEQLGEALASALTIQRSTLSESNTTDLGSESQRKQPAADCNVRPTHPCYRDGVEYCLVVVTSDFLEGTWTRVENDPELASAVFGVSLMDQHDGDLCLERELKCRHHLLVLEATVVHSHN